MTNEEAAEALTRLRICNSRGSKTYLKEVLTRAINALMAVPCEECISRQALLFKIEAVCFSKRWCKFRADNGSNGTRDYIINYIKQMPSVQPKPKPGYISIADVMSVFDDFMCGDVDEEGTETFLEMLKDKAESEAKDE